jgi:hypothetical protein
MYPIDFFNKTNLSSHNFSLFGNYYIMKRVACIVQPQVQSTLKNKNKNDKIKKLKF